MSRNAAMAWTRPRMPSMFTPNSGVNDVNDRGLLASEAADMSTMSATSTTQSLGEDSAGRQRSCPHPRRPTWLVAYMSTTAIASTGGTFTPRGEHNALSRPCGCCQTPTTRGFSPSARADSRDVSFAVSEIAPPSPRTWQPSRGRPPSELVHCRRGSFRGPLGMHGTATGRSARRVRCAGARSGPRTSCWARPGSRAGSWGLHAAMPGEGQQHVADLRGLQKRRRVEQQRTDRHPAGLEIALDLRAKRTNLVRPP